MRYYLPIILLLLACQAAAPSADATQEEWQSLFNGTDLTGWTPKVTGRPLGDNFLETFRVEDSMLRIAYDRYDTFGTWYGHLYYEQPYSYYKLRFAYRFVGEQTPGGATWNVRNSGVMLHSEGAAEVGFDQHFPVSVELQLLGGLGEGPRPTANVCTPGTYVWLAGAENRDHCLNSDSDTYDGDQWVEVEAVVLGDSIIHHIVEGDTVLTYTRPSVDSIFVDPQRYNWVQAGVDDPAAWGARAGEALSQGYIALQAESHPIDFRNIRLLDLEGCMDPKARNYKAYYVRSAPARCVYGD